MFSLPRLSVSCALCSLVLINADADRVIRAETIVVPNDFAMMEGGTPAPNATDPRRVMQVFDASQFESFGSPLLITELALRPSSTQEGPGTLTDFNGRVFFSTTSRSASTLSPVFAENVGPDYTQVSFRDTATFNTESVPGIGNTRAFDVVVPLETPFLYDPDAGSLLMEFQVGPPATEGQFIFDLVAGDPNVNMVAAFGSPNATTGDLLGLGFVTQFTVHPTPGAEAALPRGIFTDVKPVLGGSRSDFLPAVSSDTLTLFFDRFSRGDSEGLGDIWMATRFDEEERFENEISLGPDVNSRNVEHVGGISADDLTLYFGSDRSGNWDLYQASRESTDDGFGNVVSLGPGVNTQGFESLPNVTSDGLTLFYVRRESAGDQQESPGDQKRLWMATRDSTEKPFGNAMDLGDVANGERFDLERPSVSADANVIFFSDWLGTRRPGGQGQQDIWVLTRSSANQSFGEPININDLWPGTTVNTTDSEALPYISPDWPAAGSKLYFTSNQLDRVGDIFQATWVPEPSPLRAGDADQDLDFDQLDLVQVQIAAKYLTEQAATWGEGDWNGAPGGAPGDPPTGDGLFNQFDVIAAQLGGAYLTGPYGAIQPNGRRADGQTSVVYDPSTGEVAVDAPSGTELTSINVDSSAGIFTGSAAVNLGGSFDNDADGNIFKATFGSSFGSLSFGTVAQPGLSELFVLGDLTVIGSLAGGGDLGNVDLIYVPEPSSLFMVVLGILIFVGTSTSRNRCVPRQGYSLRSDGKDL